MSTDHYVVNYSATITTSSKRASATGSSQTQIEFLGTDGADKLICNDLDNNVQGLGGSDNIDAKAGNDKITVKAGYNEQDKVSGGAGTDSLTVDASSNGNGAIFWTGIGADGKALVRCDASSSMEDIQSLLNSAASFGLCTGGNNYGVTFDGIENLSITASNYGYHDLLIVLGAGNYYGNGGTDTLYADWSRATQGIVWNNAANATEQSVNGSSIANVQRLRIKTGSGDDNIGNTAVYTNDEIITGAGNDTVNAGNGDDRIETGEGDDKVTTGDSGNNLIKSGDGNDTISLGGSNNQVTAGNGDDTISMVAGYSKLNVVHGDAGSDTLTVDASLNGNGAIYWTGTNTAGKALISCDVSSSMEDIQTFLKSAATFGLRTGGNNYGVTFDNIESLSVTASKYDYEDLLIVRGTGSYNGNGGKDTLYADWSSTSQGITWENTANEMEQKVNGSTIVGVERLLIKTGGGNDYISNVNAISNDAFITGKGNDVILAGSGDDYIDTDIGDDIIEPPRLSWRLFGLSYAAIAA